MWISNFKKDSKEVFRVLRGYITVSKRTVQRYLASFAAVSVARNSASVLDVAVGD